MLKDGRKATVETYEKRADEPGYVHLEWEWREGMYPEIKDLLAIGIRCEIVYDPVTQRARMLFEPSVNEDKANHAD